MPVVARLNQYSSLLTTEFDEINGTKINVSTGGTFYSSEFSENIGITTTLTANVFAPYDLVYDEFGGTLFGAGKGIYMRQNTDKTVVIYNEIDEITSIS